MNYNIILFDGLCNFCNYSVNFIIKRDKKKVFKFAALQSDAAKKFIGENSIASLPNESVVLIVDKQIFYKSTALLKIIKKLSFPWKLLYGFSALPKGLRDYIYDFIAAYRYKIFGMRTVCKIPSEEEKEWFIQ